jgi:hypothetical protein
VSAITVSGRIGGGTTAARTATRIRAVGLVVGVCVSLGVGLLPVEGGLGFALPTSGLVELAILGAPVAAFLGWQLAPRVWNAGPGRVAGVGLAMGVLAEPLGVAVVVVAMIVGGLGSIASSDGGALSVFVLAPMLWLIGFFYGVIVLPITIPAGLLWAATVRSIAWLARRRAAR